MDRSSNDCPSSFLFLSNVCLFVPQISHTGMDLHRCVSPMFRLFCHASATTGIGSCCTSKRHTISMITSNPYNYFLATSQLVSRFREDFCRFRFAEHFQVSTIPTLCAILQGACGRISDVDHKSSIITDTSATKQDLQVKKETPGQLNSTIWPSELQ